MAGVHVSELMVYQKYPMKAVMMFSITFVDIFVRAGIKDIEQNIARAHRIGKSYHHKKSKKKVEEHNSEIYFIQISHQGLQT